MTGMTLTAVHTDTQPIGHARRLLGAAPDAARRQIDGVQLAYDDQPGPAPAVVCLHAIGHGASDFAGVRAHLRGRHRVLALDWPGHGASGDDSVAASAARYTALLAAFIDQLELDRPILLGNSIGGATALRYAAANPERVRGLVLENPGGLFALDATARTAIGAMVRFFAAGARGARWFGPAFGAYYRMVLRQPAAAAQRRRIVAAGYELAPLLRDAWRSFGEPDADQRALAPRVGCPVLFAWAKQDQIAQLRRARAAIAQFPNARLETFRAGHAAHLEAPEAFVQSLDGFLHELRGSFV